MSAADLLRILHSALIDEINERFPDERPELGLPTRHSAWEVPSDQITSCSSFPPADHASALRAALMLETGCLLEAEGAETWMRRVVQRFKKELTLRKIVLPPQFDDPRACALEELAQRMVDAQRLVWIPMRVGSGRCFLGFLLPKP